MDGSSPAKRPVVGIVGWKDSGKTTLVVRLVEHFTASGLKVSTVKHAHHSVDPDQSGKDSWRHREAGAHEVLLATGARYALFHELRGAAEPPLDELLARLAPADLVIVEGFKRFAYPKIEVHRAVRGTPLLAPEDPAIVAVASDEPLPGLRVPVLDLDDIAGIARLVRDRLELPGP